MGPSLPIYLDNHATTRVDPRVLEVMLPYFTTDYGNAASSLHEFGWRAEAAVSKARKELASLIGAEPGELVFTSGATESINMVLKGIAEAYRHRGNHIITVKTEHKATLDTCGRLEKAGFDVTYLDVDKRGQVSLEQLRKEIREQTILVSVMAANNEIGTVAPIDAIGEICRENGVLFHTDAAQAVAKIPIDVRAMNIDLLSFTSHKMYGPKGIGALFVRKGKPKVALVPLMDGGGHERGFRSGTLNVPGIVGFGAAASLAREVMGEEGKRIGKLRERLVEGIMSGVRNASLNGDPVNRLSGNTNILFRNADTDQLFLDLDGIALSAGSACSSSNPKPSHVLKAIGLTDDEARSSIRFGVGRFNSAEEIEYCIGKVVEALQSGSTNPLTRVARS